MIYHDLSVQYVYIQILNPSSRYIQIWNLTSLPWHLWFRGQWSGCWSGRLRAAVTGTRHSLVPFSISLRSWLWNSWTETAHFYWPLFHTFRSSCYFLSFLHLHGVNFLIRGSCCTTFPSQEQSSQPSQPPPLPPPESPPEAGHNQSMCRSQGLVFFDPFCTHSVTILFPFCTISNGLPHQENLIRNVLSGHLWAWNFLPLMHSCRVHYMLGENVCVYCVGAGPAAPPQRLWSVAVTCSNWPKLGFGCGFPMLSPKVQPQR